ncbi:peptidase family M1-domain-containing protein [Mycena haematopus]|nr:peptidase family M1-domain-containing protein [Mycena haematopus]
MDSTSLDPYRLPTDSIPIHYDLKIHTDLEELTFDGAVSITIRFVEDTSTIVLNVFSLELGTSYVVVDREKFIPVSQSIDTDTQRVALSFVRPFAFGSEAVLHMTFRGKIPGLSGYFKSEWVHDDVTEYYTGTFFEPAYARRAFPCWDEPALKATFAVSLISRVGTVNLSNMPAFFEGPYVPAQDPLDAAFGAGKDAAQWIITRFETTPKMSTYILAFANGPFAYVESSFTSALTGKVRLVRVYATPDLIGQAQFSLDLTTKVLPMVEKMFDLEYPLPKMDILCANGALGALENWGLIIGDPGAFLFDPATGSTATQKRVVGITSHELAHQWFGNIVTMKWWDNLWLNEGFATLVGSIISEKLYPEWNTATATVNSTLKSGLNMDATLSSHPVQVECPDANQANEDMDVITYMKGSAILRMLLNLLGEEIFFKGVALYLKEHQFKNSVAEDLWDALGRTSGTDVLNLMQTWISKPGYPVLTVTEAPGGINVRQNRFLASGTPEAKDDETLWTVPLSLLTIDSAGTRRIDKTIFLSERERFIPLDTSRLFKLNASSTGFYRVLYQSDKLNKLSLEAAKGNSADMSGLLNDAMALAKANLAKLSGALTLMDGFAGTTEYIVLEAIAANITGLLDAWWENPSIVEQLRSLDRHIFVSWVSRLGYHYDANESTDTTAIRTLAVKRAAYARDPRVVAELQTRFSAFMVNKEASPLPPNLVPAIYTVAVRHGGKKEYDYMWEILATTNSPAEEGHAAVAVGAVEDPVLMAETFERLLKEDDGKVDWLLHALSANPTSRRPMVQFFKANYDAFQARFETTGFDHYSQQPFRLLATAEDYEDTVAFFKTKDTSKFTRSLEQTLEIIQTNIKYVERSTVEILEWFASWNARHYSIQT